jgi:hypothetical protein
MNANLLKLNLLETPLVAVYIRLTQPLNLVN